MTFDNVEKVVLEEERVIVILKDGKVIVGKVRGEWGSEAWISYGEV